MNAPKPGTGGTFWPVTRGGRCVGHIVARGVQGFEGFDRNDKSLGLFKSATDAVVAVAEGGGEQ